MLMSSNRLSLLIIACALALPAAAHAQSSQQPDRPKRDTSAAPGETQSTKDGNATRFVDDAVITTRIKVEYAKDDLVQATRISVNTDKGVVRLSGVAASQAEVDKAIAIAKNTEGVTSVRNEIKIEPKQDTK
jgi:hyperosmotically inducible periplasmic protein